MSTTIYAHWDSMEDFCSNKAPDKALYRIDVEGEPKALCDRWGQSQAKAAAGQAGQLAGTEGASAQTEHAELTPFYAQEMRARHLYDPGQVDELLTAAGAGTGGATSALEGQAKLESARTRNASGFTKALDEAARQKDKANAGMSEGIAAQDVEGAKKLNQEGASGMAGLFGTDINAQLQAMGQQQRDIATEVEAGKSGWFQNAMNAVKTGADIGKMFMPT